MDIPLNNGLYQAILPFTDRDRNRLQYVQPISTPYSFANLRYQLQGDTISFKPQTANLPGSFQFGYIQQVPILVQTMPTAWVASTLYTAGQFVTFNFTINGNVITQVFLCLVGGVSGSTAPSWNVPVQGTQPNNTQDNTVSWFYKAPLTSFATGFDGISGWEDYVIIDAALKCAAKQEMDCSVFIAQKQAMMQRIEWAAANRTASDPMVAPAGWGHNQGGGGWGGFGGGYC